MNLRKQFDDIQSGIELLESVRNSILKALQSTCYRLRLAGIVTEVGNSLLRKEK